MTYISPELLITELTDKNEKLTRELEEGQQLIKDFESLALVWQSNYNKMKRDLEIEIKHLEQTIEEMKKEVEEAFDYNEEL